MKRLCLFLVLAAVASLALAETLTLRSGEKLDGDVKQVSKDGAVVERDGIAVKVGWEFLEAAEAVKAWEAKLAWDDVPGLTDLANYAEAKGLAADAKRVWEKVVKADGNHEEARAALGYVKEAGEWVLASAKKVVEEAPKVAQPGSGPPKDNLVVPASIDKRAVEHLNKGNAIIEEAKKNPKSQVEMAEAAIVSYRNALKLARDFALAWYHIGIAYQFSKDYEEAATALQSAVRINPLFFEAYVELADAYAWMRDREKAVENYRKAIEINPSYGLAWRNLAMVELKSRHLSEARAACDKALAIDGGDAFMKQLSAMIDAEIKGPGFGEAEIRKKSAHFEVITNHSEKVAGIMSENLERIYTIYEKVFPKIEKDDLVFPVVVYKDAADYQAAGSPPGTGGYFNPLVKKLVFYWMGDQKVQDTLMVLYHETFHAFLDYYLEDATQWFNEGHGDYFGAWYWDEGRKMMIQRVNWWRLGGIQAAIRADRHVPLKQLLQMTQAEMYSPQVVGVAYAEAWSIVYFMRNNSKYGAVLVNYFTQLRKGAGIRRAYDQTFGKIDMRTFEQEWKEYVNGLKNPPGVSVPGPKKDR